MPLYSPAGQLQRELPGTDTKVFAQGVHTAALVAPSVGEYVLAPQTWQPEAAVADE